MRTLFALMLFVSLFSATEARANTHPLDKIMTINRMAAADLKQAQDDCKTINSHIICTYTLYHYEVDERGQLAFAKVTASAEKNATILQPSFSVSTVICHLNPDLACDSPELADAPLDLSAYAVGEKGVSVHGQLNAWADPEKAALFLAQIRVNSEAATQTITQTQSRMMDDLACFMFDFDALVEEYKIYGRLVESHSIKKLDPDACLSCFEKICSDPGSRADELTLAANAWADDKPEKPAINRLDIRNFCNSLNGFKAAMLR